MMRMMSMLSMLLKKMMLLLLRMAMLLLKMTMLLLRMMKHATSVKGWQRLCAGSHGPCRPCFSALLLIYSLLCIMLLHL